MQGGGAKTNQSGIASWCSPGKRETGSAKDIGHQP
jgi:hypothetical protein